MLDAVAKHDASAARKDSLLCVGLDCDMSKIPREYLRQDKPQLAFNRHIIDSTAEFAAAFKANIAFYEANGAGGINQLADTVKYLRANHPDILTICDAKRSDIGNTSEAYASAIFDQLGFDAVTLNPYLGWDALAPFLRRRDKISIILCRTSNPGSKHVQNLRVEGRPLWQIIAEQARAQNRHGNLMLVASGTNPREMARIREIVGDMTLLAPGIGAQGGDTRAVVEVGVNSFGRGLLINSSRGIIFSDDPALAARTLRDRINAARYG